MDKLRDIRFKFSRNLLILIGICLSLYFSYHSVYGHRSYSQLSKLTSSVQEKTAILHELEIEREIAQNKVHMMRLSSLSIDMLDEQVRLILGYKRQGELIILDK